MRIGVIGLGAIGGVVADRLGAHLRTSSGPDALEVAAGRGDRLPQGIYDFLLLCTRTADIESALQPASLLLAPDGAVVCLTNGLPEERAARIVGKGRVLGAVIGWSASKTGPGQYLVTGDGGFVVGGDSPRRHEAAELLRLVFPVRETDNLAGARWSKLAMNCAMSTLGAVSGLSLGELAGRRAVRRLALGVMREVVAAAQARGVRLEPIAGLRPDLLVQSFPLVGHAAIWLAARKRPSQRTGMIARLREGRPAGVEDLNALIDGPLNRALVAMVREIEAGTRRIAPDNLSQLSGWPGARSLR